MLLRVNIYPLVYKGKTFMKPNTGTQNNVNLAHPELSFAWDKNPSVQKLLDAVVHILANEYVRAVKENPVLFGGKNGTVPTSEMP